MFITNERGKFTAMADKKEAKKDDKKAWKPKVGTVIWPPRKMLSVDFLMGEVPALSKYYNWVTRVYGKDYLPACKNYFDKGIIQYIHAPTWKMKGPRLGGIPPLQPVTLIIETSFPEPLYFAMLDKIAGTSGLSWNFIKLKESLALSPTTQLHGTMLAKRSAQERDAKDMLGMVQTLKTVVLNLEGDLEKLNEQKDAFEEDKTEQIKAIYVDNAGGQGRTWTSLARNVPLIKSALTWFYRLKSSDESGMLKEVDEEVREGRLNPAVANYLRRRIQEYWSWRNNYSEYIQTTYKNIKDNLFSQRANLKMYTKWAKSHIDAVDQMFVGINELDLPGAGPMVEDMPAWTPRAGSLTEWFAWDTGQAVKDLCMPWIPAMVGKAIMTFNPDTPQHKFTRAAFIVGYGVIHARDVAKIQKIISEKEEELGAFMAEHAGMSSAEIDGMLNREYGASKPKKENAFEGSISWWHEWNEALLDNMAKFFAPFGISVFDAFKTRKRRAQWFAHNGFLVYYKNMKGSLGLPIF